MYHLRFEDWVVNILFIEDEEELLAAGMEQMEFLGHTVYPAADLSQAQAILDNPGISLHGIIADRNLPDGCGIEFLKKVSVSHPRCKSAIVSAYLTDANIEDLKRAHIAYFLKPLLYSTVIADLLSKYSESLKPVDTSVTDEYAAYQKKRQAREKKRIEELHKGIELAYRGFLRIRSILVITLSVILACLAAGVAAVFYNNPIFVGTCFVLTCLAFVYRLYRLLVPTTQQREESFELIHSAVNDPARIMSFHNERVRIVGPSGNVVQLKGIELKIWRSEVVPFFLASKLEAESRFSVRGRSEKSRKLEELERRRKEIANQEQALVTERGRLRASLDALKAPVNGDQQSPHIKEQEQVLKQREAELQKRLEQLERDAQDIEARSTYVTHVENTLVERLNHLSEREASIEQQEIDKGIRADS